MASQRSRASTPDGTPSGPGDDRAQLLRVAGLFIAVIGVLLLGAILSDDGTPESSALVSAADGPVPAAAAPAANPSELDRRARADHRRLAQAGDGFTLQLAAICDPDNARRWIESAGARSELHLVPATIDDRSCYRVCWGHWSERPSAGETALPAAVSDLAEGPPRVMPVARVLR